MRSARSVIAAAACVVGGVGTSVFGQGAILSLEIIDPPSGIIRPGEPVQVEVFVENVYDASDPTPDLLRGYQATLEIIPAPGTVGSLALDTPPEENIFIDTTRSDWVFSGASTFFAPVDAPRLRLGATVFPPFFQVTARRYCGTYIFAASPGTLGDFQIRFMPFNPDEPNILPNVLLNQDSLAIPFTVSPPDGITVTVVDTAVNDACVNALPITDGVTSFNTASSSTDGPSHPGSGCDQAGSSTVSNDIWYDYVASCSGVLSVSTCGAADFDTRVAVYDGCTCPVSDADLLTCNDNGPGCGLTSEAVVNGVVSGNCYKVRVGGTGDVTGLGSLSVACIDNDLCTTAEPLSVGSSVEGSTQGTAFNDSTGLDCGLGPVDSPGVWYTVTGNGDRMTVTLPSASYDTRLTIYEGSCTSLSCVGDADNVGGSQESITWCSVPGVVYRILVHGSNGAGGAFTLNVGSASCDDQNACTDDTCSGGVCNNVPNYDDVTFCCAPFTGNLTVIDDGNPCTDDVCNAATGLVSHPPGPDGPNVACDDNRVCTLDECVAGECTNTDINTILCQSDLDCPPDTICGDGSGDTQAGVCFCDSGPTLELVPQPGASPIEGCFGVGETITVRVEMGTSEEAVVGAQFFLEYDPQTLDFIDIRPGVEIDPSSPFAFPTTSVVDESLGTIDYLVGISLEAPPTTGPDTVAFMTFETLGECDAFVRYRPSGPGGQPNVLSGVGGVQVDPILIDAPLLNIDLDPPVITSCPGDITTPPDPGLLTAVVTWAPPTATDSCDAGPVTITCTPPSGSVFSPGTTSVVCSATDSCGLANSSCVFNVTVEPPILIVDVELSAEMTPGPLERCITFDVWDCDGPPVAQHAVVEQNLTFINGMASAAEVPLPGGAWECLTVRDRLHTLRSTAVDFTTSDGVLYTATVSGPRAQGGHWLVGGNLNDDEYIDILDFGVMFPQHRSVMNPNTLCGIDGPDGNINGDSLVDLLDFVIFVGNTLMVAEAGCCGAGAVSDASGPITSITVSELRHRGLEHMIAADVNCDGVLDMEDVMAVINGNIPPSDHGESLTDPERNKSRRRGFSNR